MNTFKLYKGKSVLDRFVSTFRFILTDMNDIPLRWEYSTPLNKLSIDPFLDAQECVLYYKNGSVRYYTVQLVRLEDVLLELL